MLDDFRKQADAAYGDDDDAYLDAEERITRRPFLGLTAAQRFLLTLMLLLLTCLIGAFALLATGRVVLPLM
jgi:hypothetical protein